MADSGKRHRMTRREKINYICLADKIIHSDNTLTVLTKEEMRESIINYFIEEIDKKLIYIRSGQGIGISFFIEPLSKNKTFIIGPELRNTDLYTEWRNAVLTRDKFTCRMCHKGGFLHAHHLKPWADYPDERFNVDNGITLCVECHAEFHPLHKHLILYQSDKEI